jgi:hypothetical protein
VEKAAANFQIKQHFIRTFGQKKKGEKKMGELKKKGYPTTIVL